MSDNAGQIWIVALLILAAFLFAGSPDMTDVLIAKINGTCVEAP